MAKSVSSKDGDMAVGELGFGSVAEGGSFIALPAEPSEEIKLENGQGVLPSSKLSSRQASVSSVEKDKAEEKDTLAELPARGQQIVDADPAALADGVVQRRQVVTHNCSGWMICPHHGLVDLEGSRE